MPRGNAPGYAFKHKFAKIANNPSDLRVVRMRGDSVTAILIIKFTQTFKTPHYSPVAAIGVKAAVPNSLNQESKSFRYTKVTHPDIRLSATFNNVPWALPPDGFMQQKPLHNLGLKGYVNVYGHAYACPFS